MARAPTSLTSLDLTRTIAGRFVKVGDSLRDLNTKFGVRRCIVRQVRTKWSGGRRWSGEEAIVSEVELLPNPKVVDLSTLREVVSSTALTEAGSVVVDELSGTFTEDFLRGIDERGAIPEDESFYYEIEFKSATTGPGVKRRFTLASNPSYVADDVRWVITLNAAQGGRQRDGSPR
jgi:hypothetical protein